MYEVVDHVKLVVTLARNEYIFITNYFDTSRSVVEWVGAQCVALNFFNLLLFILLFFFLDLFHTIEKWTTLDIKIWINTGNMLINFFVFIVINP